MGIAPLASQGFKVRVGEPVVGAMILPRSAR